MKTKYLIPFIILSTFIFSCKKMFPTIANPAALPPLKTGSAAATCDPANASGFALSPLGPIDASLLQVKINSVNLLPYDSTFSTLLIDFEAINSLSDPNYQADYGQYSVCTSNNTCIKGMTGVWLEEVILPTTMTNQVLSVSVQSCVVPERRATAADCGPAKNLNVTTPQNSNPQLASALQSIHSNLDQRNQLAFTLAGQAKTYLDSMKGKIPANDQENILVTTAQNLIANPYYIGGILSTPLVLDIISSYQSSTHLVDKPTPSLPCSSELKNIRSELKKKLAASIASLGLTDSTTPNSFQNTTTGLCYQYLNGQISNWVSGSGVCGTDTNIWGSSSTDGGEKLSTVAVAAGKIKLEIYNSNLCFTYSLPDRASSTPGKYFVLSQCQVVLNGMQTFAIDANNVISMPINNPSDPYVIYFDTTVKNFIVDYATNPLITKLAGTAAPLKVIPFQTLTTIISSNPIISGASGGSTSGWEKADIMGGTIVVSALLFGLAGGGINSALKGTAQTQISEVAHGAAPQLAPVASAPTQEQAAATEATGLREPLLTANQRASVSDEPAARATEESGSTKFKKGFTGGALIGTGVGAIASYLEYNYNAFPLENDLTPQDNVFIAALNDANTKLNSYLNAFNNLLTTESALLPPHP